MPTPVSAADDAIVNFAAMLRLRVGLAGVNVFEEPQNDKHLGKEWIVVATSVEADQEEQQLGALTIEETLTLRGALVTSMSGAGEADARALRQRAYVILGEIKSLLRTKSNADVTLSGLRLGGAVSWARLTHYEYEPSATPDQRFAQITFDVTCVAQLRAS